MGTLAVFISMGPGPYYSKGSHSSASSIGSIPSDAGTEPGGWEMKIPLGRPTIRTTLPYNSRGMQGPTYVTSRRPPFFYYWAFRVAQLLLTPAAYGWAMAPTILPVGRV